jgi:hypothetical protein
MKAFASLVVIAAALSACNSQPMLTPAANLGAVAQARQATPVAPLVIKPGLTLRYAITAKEDGKTGRAEHKQVIKAVRGKAVTVTHTIPDQYGKPYTFDETVQLDNALVSARWSSFAVLSPSIDTTIGLPETVTVKAGTFKTQRVDLRANGTSETWWFSGQVPVKVAFTGLKMGKLDLTAELASYK